MLLSYLLRRQGQLSKYQKQSCYQTDRNMGWWQVLNATWITKCPLVPQFPPVRTLVLAHALSSREWAHGTSPWHLCPCQRWKPVTLRWLRAWLVKECSGGFQGGYSIRLLTLVKPRLCIQSPYLGTCQLDSVSVLPLPWLCHCRGSQGTVCRLWAAFSQTKGGCVNPVCPLLWIIINGAIWTPSVIASKDW